MVLFHSSPTNFETEMAVAFGLLRQSLTMSLHQMGHGVDTTAADLSKYKQLQEKLLKQSIKLNETYSQAAFELRVGRLNCERVCDVTYSRGYMLIVHVIVKTVRPLIGIVEHLRRELAWGMSPLLTPPNLTRLGAGRTVSVTSEVRMLTVPSHGIDEPGLILGQAILHALEVVEQLVTVAFAQGGSSSGSGKPVFVDKTAIQQEADALVLARNATIDSLKLAFQKLDTDTGQQSDEFTHELFDHTLAIIALLQVRCIIIIYRVMDNLLKCSLLKMAHEMLIALHVAQHIATLYEGSSARLWYPRLSLSWLGVPPGPYITNEDGIPLHISGASTGNDIISTGEPDPEAGMSFGETREALAEHGLALDLEGKKYREPRVHYNKNVVNAAAVDRPRVVNMLHPWNTVAELFERAWSHPSVLRLRLLLAKYHRAVHHSNHIRHAFKNAIGVAILTFPAFMPATSRGKCIHVHSVSFA